jgi:hypothetical protein
VIHPPARRRFRPDTGRSNGAVSSVTLPSRRRPRSPSPLPTPPGPRPDAVPPPTTQPAPISASPSPDAPRRRRTQGGRNRPLSRINWRATVAHHPAQDMAGRQHTAESGSLRSRAGLRRPSGACPRCAAGHAATCLHLRSRDRHAVPRAVEFGDYGDAGRNNAISTQESPEPSGTR